MFRYITYPFCSLFCCLILFSCATYETHINEDEIRQQQNIKDNDSDHNIYLIGDAGGAKMEENLNHFESLKSKLSVEQPNSTVIFLGDNIYEKGMPKKDSDYRKLAEHRIDTQLDLVENYEGRVIFIPGNHDYYSGRIKGVKRQSDYIKKQTGKSHLFLPENGCPIEKIDLNDEAVLIIVDSQWYLEDWDKSPTKNDDCDIKTREQFFETFESLVKKNAMKTTIVAIHHPMFSGGPHGGQFRFGLLSTLPNLLRKTSGGSVQDQQNSIFMEFKKRLVTLSQNGEKLVFVSGHEHLLQYLEKDNVIQIISGSGSLTSRSRPVSGSHFSMGSLGYSKLELQPQGAAKVSFFKSETYSDTLVFTKQIFEPEIEVSESLFPKSYPNTEMATIYSKEEVDKGKGYTFFWGKHYRDFYGTPIKANAVLLDTLKGGLTPVRKGGGHQSNSLRLEDNEGKEYVLRALRKNPIRFMQSGMFKDQYIEGKYNNTFTEGILLDVFTAAHPFAPMAIGPLMDAIDIYHPNTVLYYVPKQPALLNFNEEFGDELYFLEERAASGHGDLKNFGFSNKIISSGDMMSNLRESENYYIDEDTYIRARLLDMVIGDWDRHKDQWRWAEFKEGKQRMYKPVPRDRDQAFSKYDGFLMDFNTRFNPAAKKLTAYDHEIRSAKWFNTNAFPVDKALINRSVFEDWLKQVAIVQENITEEVIDDALSKIPSELQDESIEEIKSKMKSRVANLKEIAKEYHDFLIKYPVIKGNDKDNYFEINRLKDGSTSVAIYNIKDGETGSKISEKTYNFDKTKEIWIYGLDDKDVFEVTGKSNKAILIRLIGGQNMDTYKIHNGKNVVMHDFKDKKNHFESKKGRIRLSNDYEKNLYNYKKNRYSQNQLLPAIGFNPDDGFRLGINNIFTVYGFNRNPFSSQHSIKAHYYFATNGFDISYSYELANVIKKWNLLLMTGATSPNYSINFYGFGNETINEEDVLGQDYHRVRMSAYVAYPKLKWHGRMGAEIELGGLFEGIELENTEGRFVNNIPDFQEDRQYYLGAQGKYAYENYDNVAFPTLGMRFELEAGWKTNTNNNFDDLTYLRPALNITHRIDSNGRLVFATKLKGNLVWGDEIEFYNAASIGGKDGLRGYRNQRFTGDKSFYQNSDLRYNIKEIKTGLLPLQMAIFGGFDYGRVWLDGEDSNSWKTSYGGGFSIAGAQMFNLKAALFGSDDGMYFTFGMGFDF